VILYFGVVRPIQSIFLDEIIIPYLDNIIYLKKNYIITASQDDLIINSVNDYFVETRVSLPFSAYYFLIIITFFQTSYQKFINYIHRYNLLLLIISPFLTYFFLQDIYWLSLVINAHEISYKYIFLCIGMLIGSKELKIR
jgi:hypothetical protein